jgi:Plasma-membrane choline transporter
VCAQAERPPWRDFWCGVAFWLQMVLLLVLAFGFGAPAIAKDEVLIGRWRHATGLNVSATAPLLDFSEWDAVDVSEAAWRGVGEGGSGTNSSSGGGGSNSDLEVSEFVWFLALAAGVGAVVSSLFLWVMYRFAGVLIAVCYLTSALVCFVVGATLVVYAPVAGVVALVVGLVILASYFCLRAQIGFASATLRTAARAVHEYWGVLVAAAVSIVVQVGFVPLWSLACAGMLAAIRYHAAPIANDGDRPVPPSHRHGHSGDDDTSYGYRGSPSSEYLVAGVVFMVFSFAWTMQVIRNTLFVTVAGTVGTWWISPDTRDPTMGSVQRALTTSFGSIAFGSLVVAVLRTLRSVARAVSRASSADGNRGMALLACLCMCFLGCLARTIQYFNEYAYVGIALYGRSYLEAARGAYQLFVDRGFLALLEDTIIDNVLGMGCLAAGLLSAAISGSTAFLVIHSAQGANQVAIVASTAAAGFLVGFLMASVVSGVIEGAVKTVFVSFADVPEALNRTHPTAYADLHAHWIELVNSGGFGASRGCCGARSSSSSSSSTTSASSAPAAPPQPGADPATTSRQQQFTRALPVPTSYTRDDDRAIYVAPPVSAAAPDAHRATIAQSNSGYLTHDEMGIVPPPSAAHYDV